MSLHIKYAALLLCLFMLPVGAVVFGGSNFGFSGYPDPNCSQPHKPYEFHDDWARQNFIAEVEQYLSCVQEYADNAENDVKRVLEARDEAIQKANTFVDSL